MVGAYHLEPGDRRQPLNLVFLFTGQDSMVGASTALGIYSFGTGAGALKPL
jgi:hypothetical protein